MLKKESSHRVKQDQTTNSSHDYPKTFHGTFVLGSRTKEMPVILFCTAKGGVARETLSACAKKKEIPHYYS